MHDLVRVRGRVRGRVKVSVRGRLRVRVRGRVRVRVRARGTDTVTVTGRGRISVRVPRAPTSRRRPGTRPRSTRATPCPHAPAHRRVRPRPGGR